MFNQGSQRIGFILSHPIRRPLYSFLKKCNESPLEKEVLDCGAGGSSPPLALFYENGYKTHGIDISDEQLALAEKFCQEFEIELDIVKGDMREIPFEDESISFVYSINTIVHLSKIDTIIALKEIERVLKPTGLLYVNFASIERADCGHGRELNRGEWLRVLDNGKKIFHSFYEDDEPDRYFDHFEIIQKEKRIITLPISKISRGRSGWQGADIGYIARKT
ncbi:MAG: class I SAM-dependent methyltransferase [Promethearchaeota archaeon]